MTALAAVVLLLVLAALASAVLRLGPRASAALNASAVVAAGVVCAERALCVLASGEALELVHGWQVPGGALALGLDPLSAFFLLPVALLSALGACYGAGCLGSDPRAPRGTWPLYSLLVAGMLLVLLARNAVLFLAAWEGMSLAAWALVACDASAEGRRASWIYLVASHAGSAALFLLFAVLAQAAGDPADFAAMRAAPTALPLGALLLLGLLGFGVKAGVLPLHVWIPEAHAAVPSHVSALMSGAMVKLGLYGLLRLSVLLGPLPPSAGAVLAVLGLAGALLGIGLALQQRDLKRALACSSIENLGLIAFGLGLALWGQASGAPGLALFALAGALLHAWNHSAMKGLMFLCAGAALHGKPTRDLERMGGLLARMPVSGVCMLVGGVALAGLPPLNGFAGEWLLFRALLDGGLALAGGARVAVLLAAALLALLGALAAACFVRLIGVALLGEPRSAEAAASHEVGRRMLVPIVLLAAVCVDLGIAPGLAVRGFASVAQQLLGAQGASPPALAQVASVLAPLGALASATWLALAAAGLCVWLGRWRPVARGETWACGYGAVSPRMQYTARSFSELLGRTLLPVLFAPRLRVLLPQGYFPPPGKLSSQDDEPLTRAVYEPLFDAIARRCVRLRVLQQGRAHLYVGYVLAAVLVSLLWVSLRALHGAGRGPGT